MMEGAFQIDSADNVATLLQDAAPGLLPLHGPAGTRETRIHEKIALGHKVALAPIAKDAPIVKYGVVIGVATEPIAAGDWVHLHNCRSLLDERSSQFAAPHETAGGVPHV